MKKITFLTFLLISFLGFSQNLVTNGDFQANSGGPATGWTGNASNAVDLGGNNIVNQAQITNPDPGQPFLVNLSQNINLENGKTYELMFDAFTDATTGSRTIIAGLGQNNAPFAALTQTPTITSTPQTFIFQFTINYGDGVGDRVLFDMAAQGGFVFIDNVSVIEIVNLCNNGVQDPGEGGVDCGGTCPNACPTPPNVPAPTPPGRAAADVVNVYSGAYANSQTLTGDNFGVGANTSIWAEGVVSGDSYWAITNSGDNFVGFNFSSAVDASQMTRFHFDYWTTGQPVGGVINVKMSNHSAGLLTGETNAAIHLINPPGADGQWNSVDIPISDFNVGEFNGGISSPASLRASLSQMVIIASGAGGALFQNIYFDNVYFHNGNVLSTEDFEIAGLKVFPNPSSTSWTIKTKSIEMSTITLYDILGKSVLTVSPNADEASVDGSSLKSGLYFAQIKTESGVGSLKLVKQ